MNILSKLPIVQTFHILRAQDKCISIEENIKFNALEESIKKYVKKKTGLVNVF